MAYVDMSANWAYKDLITYQDLNQLGENDKVHNHDGTNGADLAATTEFASAVTRYLVVPPSAFVLATVAGGGDMTRTIGRIMSGSNTAIATVIAPVNLPDGAIVTGVSAWWNRTDAAAAGSCDLQHNTSTDYAAVSMATCDSNASTGYHTVTDTSITDATIDNTTRSYSLLVGLDPNDAQADVFLLGVLITYTVVRPLP